jgi:serine/threonine protein kinase
LSKKYGDWQVEKTLGEGGQAHTFIVHNILNEEKKQFVLKRLKNKNRLERFKKEVRAGLSLSHPNVVKVVASDLEAADPYFVAEFCRGGALGDADLSVLTDIDRLSIFLEICQGVGFAHSNGVVHRDLKPDNVFLREDMRTPVVGDFGLCFITEEGERFTLVDEAVGPRWYIAPELAHGFADEITMSSDVYSLGKVLYWMLAGRIFDRELHRTPRYDLTKDQVAPDFFFIYDLLDRMIVEEPSKRFENANLVAEAISEVIRRIKVEAHHINPTTPQSCMYCGVGFYQKVVDDPPRENHYPLDYTTTINFGLEPKGSFGGPSTWIPRWLIFACDYCGNVQMFRPDYAKNKSVWKK